MDKTNLVIEFENDLEEMKYFYMDMLVSSLGYSLRRLGIKEINDNIVLDFKEAISNSFFGGMEPEFETEESYNKWEYFSAENLIFSNVDINGSRDKNPYKDKSIPYLQLKKYEL